MYLKDHWKDLQNESYWRNDNLVILAWLHKYTYPCAFLHTLYIENWFYMLLYTSSWKDNSSLMISNTGEKATRRFPCWWKINNKSNRQNKGCQTTNLFLATGHLIARDYILPKLLWNLRKITLFLLPKSILRALLCDQNRESNHWILI